MPFVVLDIVKKSKMNHSFRRALAAFSETLTGP